jgi:3-hydroxyisobutyrate dehydrogenase-like beta-hydroxyacid dehydrogenase
MFRAKVPKIIAGDFSSTGDLDIHVKDLEIVTRAAHDLGVPVMLATSRMRPSEQRKPPDAASSIPAL